MLPLYGEPDTAAFAITLTYIVLVLLPAAEITRGEALLPTLLAKVDEVETSKPVGGVTVIEDVISVPFRVKLLVEEAVPYVVLNELKEPEVPITGTTE